MEVLDIGLGIVNCNGCIVVVCLSVLVGGNAYHTLKVQIAIFYPLIDDYFPYCCLDGLVREYVAKNLMKAYSNFLFDFEGLGMVI